MTAIVKGIRAPSIRSHPLQWDFDAAKPIELRKFPLIPFFFITNGTSDAV